MQNRFLVIGIHGLANKPPKEEKRKWWKAAIEEGLERNLGAARDFAFDFVYWADIRNDIPLDDDHNHEPYRRDEGVGPFPAHDPEASEAEKLTLGDRLYRGIEWVQEKTGLTPVDDTLIEYRLDDLWGYLEDAAFRSEARGRLRAVIEAHAGARILLAAHSMGALIAYDVLRIMEREGAGVDVAHLVTLGAPLGLAEVRLKMQEEHGDLRVPGNVRRWSNLIDRADVATYGEDIGDAYRPNGAGIRAEDVAVINAYRRPDGAENRHKSYGYLRTPEFSRAVDDFLVDRQQPARRESEAAE